MITKPGRGRRVFVGVSGGVDSSVSALLLKLYGYDVTGVFIRTWQPDWIECTWRDERRDAMRVCAHLEIPFVELDLEQEYKTGVADYMIREYRAGRTPNPDVMCNREVKFGGFLNYTTTHGADFVATGHYAVTDGKKLYKGADTSKDQSYFLWTLTNDQLQHILFPVGNLQKYQVRKLAKWFNLPTAIKKDSQGICFIGDIDMKEFLRHYIDVHPGDVLDESGKIIGSHEGALFYTLGERHGFIVTDKGTNDRPYYVIAKDVDHNTITVSDRVVYTESSANITLIDMVLRHPLDSEKKYTAQIRYHGEFFPCSIELRNAGAVIYMHKNPGPVASGQSVVIYERDLCVGGGIVL